MRRAAPALVLLLATARAEAHVAPAVDTNNRYLAVTPMADRIRLSYTILIGETPGRIARHGLDADHDGKVSDAESQGWAQDLAARVQAALTVTLDGHPMAVRWAEVDVGMDDRSVDAGAFSLDLVAWMCAPDAGATRDVTLLDTFALRPPGETELRVADQPGVRVDVATVGGTDMTDHLARFELAPTPLADAPLHVAYTVVDAKPLADGVCPAPSSPSKGAPVWPVVLVCGAVASIGGFVAARRRRR